MTKPVFSARLLAIAVAMLLWGSLGLSPVFGQAPGSVGAAEHTRLGIEYLNKGHYQHAPRNQAAQAEQQYRLAEKEFRAAIASDPSHTDAHRNLAHVLSLRRDYAGAAEEYRKVVELSVDDLDAYVKLALALIELQRAEEAVTILETAKTRTTDEKALAALDQYLARLRAYRASGAR